MYRYILPLLLFIFTFSCAHERKGIILHDVHFYNGKIEFGLFYQDTIIKINEIEYLFKENTPVRFDPYFGRIVSAYLAHDQIIEINGTLFPLKAITINGIGHYNIAFHENGMPRLFWLSEDIVIPVGSTSYSFRGVQTYILLVLDGPLDSKIPNDPLETIELYDNGNLYNGYLNEEINYNGISIPAGTSVIFTRDGKLEKYYDIEQGNYIIVSNLENNTGVIATEFDEGGQIQ